MKLLNLILLLFILSCNSSFKNDRDSELFKSIGTNIELDKISIDCKKYIKKDLKKSWKFNEQGNCYFESERIRLSLLSNEDCFKAFSSSQLVLLLGEANSIFNDDNGAKILTYYLGKKCGKYYPYWTIHFIYSKDDSLLRISMDQISIE